MRNYIQLMVAGLAAMALSVQAGRIVWDFNDGTMQGWKNIRTSTQAGGSIDLSFAPVTSETIVNGVNGTVTFTASQLGLGSYFLGETPDANDGRGDIAHKTIWAESPAFKLDGSGDLTFKMNGSVGGGSANFVFTTIPQTAGPWDSQSVTGAALRRDDGVFVLTKIARGAGMDYNQGFFTFSFTAAELATLDQSRAYTFDVIDSCIGNPAALMIDDVSIPGSLVMPMVHPTLQIRPNTNSSKLDISWNPTLSGQVQTLISSTNLSTPTANWTAIQAVTTDEATTSVQIDAPQQPTFFGLRSGTVYAECPAISASPLNTTEFAGNAATLSVSAEGSLLTYQWYKGGSLIAGQTNSSLTFSNVSTNDAGIYSVVVCGITGNSLTNSATLTVIPCEARQGATSLVPYVPEAKQVFTPDQFGTNKYFSPTFGFSIDWNPNRLSAAQRQAIGINLFNIWALTEEDKLKISFGDGMAYMTENGLHGELEGAKYFESTLAAYEDYLWKHMPSFGLGGNDKGIKLVIYDVESSLWWSKECYTGSSHWPTWDSVKNHTVVCESDGVTRTLEQIDQQNLWSIEESIRRANRMLVMFQVTRAKGAPGIELSYGPSLYQGMPRLDLAPNNGIFLEGTADISHIGGVNGNITLNGRQYTNIVGSPWMQEQVMCGYYYLWNFDLLSYQDYADIWLNKLPATQNYPYVWSKMRTLHIVADEKGFLQLNRRLMDVRLGGKHGIVRMAELVYESDSAGYVPDTGWILRRIPFDDLQPNVTGNGEAPKIWQPPYLQYSRYCVTRFFAGNDPGWGFHLFPVDPTWISRPLTNNPNFNHHVHAVTALLQARHDMQPYEAFYPGSTLVEDPEVQLNQTGSFLIYNGTEAYNNNGGVQGIQKPAYMLRYKAVAGGWQVVILGGINQDWTTERTDIVRAPGGLLNGNRFRVKLRGPSATVYSFNVKSSDTNQVYEALPVADTLWEKPGYAGRTRAN